MKSYIKIYGPPMVQALRALEKIAVESPEVLITGFYDALAPSPGTILTDPDETSEYFTSLQVEIPTPRKERLISKSGHTLGDYDFFFEWAKNPSWKELEDLITKIDEVLTPLGCRYTITTK